MNLGKQLHKLGAFAFKHPGRVIGIWAAIIAILAPLAIHFMQPLSNAIAIPGTQAQQSIDQIEKVFPDSAGGSGRIVFHTTDSKKITDDKTQIEATVDKLSKVDGVTMAVSPFANSSFISKDGKTAYSQVQLKKQVGSIDEVTFDGVTKAVDEARTKGLQVEMAGDVINSVPSEYISIGEVVGVFIALMVLLITFGSLVAAGMPLASSLLAVGASMAGLFALDKVLDINSTTPVLAVMLGLAVGIDYALFIINKHRTLALSGKSYENAASKALGTAGNAVVFAAMTVIIALAALSVVNIPFMTIMGLVGAASIAVAALSALTLTPAFLGLAKDKVFGKKQRKIVEVAQKNDAPVKNDKEAKKTNRWSKLITSRPIPVLLAAIVAIGAISIPMKDLQLGLPSDQYSPADTTQKKAYDLLSDGFGVGFNAPLVVMTENLPKVSDADKKVVRDQAMAQYNKQVAEATRKQQQMFQQRMQQATTSQQMQAVQQEITRAQAQGQAQQRQALAKIDKQVNEYAKYVQLKKVSDNIAKLDDVQQTVPAMVTDDGTKGIIQVIPKSAPYDKQTSDLITNLRNTSTQKSVTGSDSVKLGITGSIALQDDINSKLGAALPLYIAMVVGLSLILLMLAFRSILVPVKATVGFLLTLGAAFGALVAVFQWGWFGIAHAPGPIVSFIPIIATGILFGLAMDYEFFLVSGMHEAYQRTKDADESVVHGFNVGAKVVTAAAIIMISVFAGFVMNEDATIQAIGFILAFGIMIDAFVVRMTIVPAVMKLLGARAWWLPEWLDKKLPHVSIEGEN
ncbi:MAG: MMPL family transporter [Micrococcaceae bacterium]